jgi:hypothetical protein
MQKVKKHAKKWKKLKNNQICMFFHFFEHHFFNLANFFFKFQIVFASSETAQFSKNWAVHNETRDFVFILFK